MLTNEKRELARIAPLPRNNNFKHNRSILSKIEPYLKSVIHRQNRRNTRFSPSHDNGRLAWPFKEKGGK